MPFQNCNNWIIGTVMYVASDYSNKWKDIIPFYMGEEIFLQTNAVNF